MFFQLEYTPRKSEQPLKNGVTRDKENHSAGNEWTNQMN